MEEKKIEVPVTPEKKVVHMNRAQKREEIRRLQRKGLKKAQAEALLAAMIEAQEHPELYQPPVVEAEEVGVVEQEPGPVCDVDYEEVKDDQG